MILDIFVVGTKHQSSVNQLINEIVIEIGFGFESKERKN